MNTWHTLTRLARWLITLVALPGTRRAQSLVPQVAPALAINWNARPRTGRLT